MLVMRIIIIYPVHASTPATVALVTRPCSVAEVFDYWAHASAIDIGEDMSAPDNFENQAQVGHFFV